MELEHHLQVSFECQEKLSVRRFTVQEELSELFRIELLANSPNDDIDLEKITGKPASFRVMPGMVGLALPERFWTGICQSIEQVQPEAKGESSYRVVIVPQLWLLTQRRGSRIYQHKTIPEIVALLLGEWKIVPKTNYQEKYLKLEYVVQYGETDYHFFCRLLERAGITFYFTFADGKVELNLNDHPHDNAKRAGPPIPYVDNPSVEGELEFVSQVTLMHQVQPGVVTFRDFDFRRKPDYELFGTDKTKNASETFYEQYVYEPGGFLEETGKGAKLTYADDKGHARHDDDVGTERAVRALRSFRQRKRFVTFSTNCVDLAPGMVIAMARHLRDDLAPTKTLLLTSFSLSGTHIGKWSCAGSAVFNDLRYQPELRTERPRIVGVQSAMVVGPKGQEIHTDEFGRVRVQFHWDREGKYDDNSSCWIRVSQQWAGAGFGMVMLPRIGQEVLVGFLEGDPDQPVVVGRVYNATTRVPYKLPAHKTRSTWKSDSTPKSQGFNEIMLEDLKGRELFYVQAQHDLQKLVKQQETERTKDNRMAIVGRNRQEIVSELDSTMVGKRHVVEMVKPPTSDDLKVLKQEAPTLSPLPTKVQMDDQGIIFTTGEASMVLYKNNIWLEAKGDISLKAKGSDLIIEAKPVEINTSGPPAAPKATDAPKMEPGLFKGLATIEEHVLKADVPKLAGAAPDVAAPTIAKAGPPPGPVNVIVCELLSGAINCSHGRVPSKEGLLEVVPAVGGDTIALKSTANGGCGRHPLWRISGAASEEKVGATQQYKATDARVFTKSARGLIALMRVDPKSYQIAVEACSGVRRSWTVHTYPYGDVSTTITFDALKGILEKIEQALSFLKVQVELQLLVGSVSGRAGWKEHTDHRAYCEIAVEVGFSPLLGISAKLPIPLPGPLGVVNKFLDAWGVGSINFFVKLWAQLDAKGTMGAKLGLGVAFGSFTIGGTILGLALGIELNALKDKTTGKDMLHAECSISGEIAGELPFTAEATKRSFEVMVTPKITLGKVKGAASLTVVMGKIPFTKRHLEVTLNREVVIYEGYPIYEGKKAYTVWPQGAG